MFAVEIRAHQLADGRYTIPARVVKLPAANEAHAKLLGVREAHAGLPRWRPLIRASLEHTTAKAIRP
jgi:hypothetical protein